MPSKKNITIEKKTLESICNNYLNGLFINHFVVVFDAFTKFKLDDLFFNSNQQKMIDTKR